MSRLMQLTRQAGHVSAMLAAVLLAAACQAQTPAAVMPTATVTSAAKNTAAGDLVTSPSGLQYKDSKVGTGAVAKAGTPVTVHYTGWLQNPDGSQGKKFDSSRDANRPFTFTLGAGNVIRGWDEGVQGMQVGGQRRLVIPAALGYGQRGAGGGLIPPGATLIFDVELLSL
jgi:FKBP-type peptidyl-prolyl cis-trans isomerase FkpA